MQRIQEEQQRYCQRWVAAVHAARTSRTRAPARAEDTTVRGRPKRPVRFGTPSAPATLTACDASSAHASSRTADAMPSPLTGPKYFMRSKESWRQLVERVRHHKNPESSSQHNSDNISSDSPTATQQSMEKRERKFPRRHEFEEDKEGGRTGGGEAHQRLSKHAKMCKGEYQSHCFMAAPPIHRPCVQMPPGLLGQCTPKFHLHPCVAPGGGHTSTVRHRQVLP